MKAATWYFPLFLLVPLFAYCTSKSKRAGHDSGAATVDGSGGSAGAAGESSSPSASGAAGAAGEDGEGAGDGDGGTGGGEQGVSAQAPVVPPIPTPGALGEVPDSEVMTSIQPWNTFRPPLDRALCDWGVRTERCYYFPGDSEEDACPGFTSTPEVSGEYFSDEIPNGAYDAPLALPNPWGYRMALVEDGERLAPNGSVEVDEVLTDESNGVDLVLNAIYDYDCPALQTEPYMRWDRFWRVVELDSDGPFLLIDGDVEGSMSATYTTGVSFSETTTFVYSTTTSVSVEFEGLGAAFEDAISEVYSSTITLSEETSHEFSQTVRGVAGATRQFMVWQLVDRLSVTDSEGEPLHDPSYEFPPVLLEIPSAKALKVTDFEP